MGEDDAMSEFANCTIACEAMPECSVCGQVKKPRGRSASPFGPTYCDHECPGYNAEPRSGHLWPGELQREETTDGE
jgi:hypothetical protein